MGRQRKRNRATVEAWIAEHDGRAEASVFLRFFAHDIEPQSLIPALLEELVPALAVGYFRITERNYFNGGKPFDWEWEQIQRDTEKQLEREREGNP